MFNLLFLIYGLFILGTIITVLMENRQPVKAMAWLMVLVFIPVGGIILYFFFGQNTRKQRHISQRSLDQLSKQSMLEFVEQKNLKLPERHRMLIQQFLNENWALPFKDNTLDIYTSGHDFFLALLRSIGAAQDHIHISTYIMEDDPLGRLVADALIDKARKGVEVRLIYDDVGCWRVKDAFFRRMRDAGIDVQPFMPVRFPAFTSKMNYRNHRKVCVIDGRVGFIGGMNIALRYIKGTRKQAWRDTHLCIRGGAVYALQRTFLIDHYFVSRTLITSRRYYPPLHASSSPSSPSSPSISSPLPREGLGVGQSPLPREGLGVGLSPLAQVVTSSPISPWPEIMQGYVRILLEARHYVYMESPYFLPTEVILFAMRTAALSGVDVRLMVPYHADAKLVEWASRSYLMQTLESGVKVYLYKAGFNHSKLIVCDDSLASCGSNNIDFRSFENNFEANIFFYDEATALKFKQIFLDDQRDCVLITDTRHVARRPFYKRLWESLVRLLSPLL